MKRKPSRSPDRSPKQGREKARPQRVCPALYQVVVECQDEREQQRLYEQLRQKGYPCRLLML